MTKSSFLPHPIPAAAMVVISLGIAIAASTSASTAASTSESTGSGAAPLPISCAVELHDTGRMVEITARLATDQDIHGSYAMEIGKSGSGGTSMIRQGGPFELAAGANVVLGKTMMNGDPANFEIDFTLDWNGMALRCPSIEI